MQGAWLSQRAAQLKSVQRAMCKCSQNWILYKELIYGVCWTGGEIISAVPGHHGMAEVCRILNLGSQALQCQCKAVIYISLASSGALVQLQLASIYDHDISAYADLSIIVLNCSLMALWSTLTSKKIQSDAHAYF